MRLRDDIFARAVDFIFPPNEFCRWEESAKLRQHFRRRLKREQKASFTCREFAQAGHDRAVCVLDRLNPIVAKRRSMKEYVHFAGVGSELPNEVVVR